MTYYEELGLTPDASSEEIKESYRNLVRLLHPDQQTNDTLKQTADREMKRINQIYATLTDPDRRRRYDAETSEHTERPTPIIIKAPPAPPPPRPRWETIAWMAAVVLCVALISFAITREGTFASGPDSSKPQPPAEPGSAELASRTGPMAPDSEGRPGSAGDLQYEAANLRMQLRVALMERDAAMEQLAKLRASRQSPVMKAPSPNSVAAIQQLDQPKPSDPTPAAIVAAPPPVSTPAVPEPVKSTLAGAWIYAAPKTAPANKALYPPEYIETIVVEDGGDIRGRYRARYRVLDRAISPEVAFEFAGKSSGTSVRLPWSGAGGAKGQVSLKLISNNSMRVEWSATELGTLGLVSGTAVLFRRPEP